MCIADYSLYDPESSGPGDNRDLDVIVEELMLITTEEGRQLLARLEENRADCAQVIAAAQDEPGIPVFIPTPEQVPASQAAD